MSKYHKGDKFIVKIKEVIESDIGRLYRSDFKTLTFNDNGLDKLQKYDEPTISEDTLEMVRMKALNEGRNDAWELARKISHYTSYSLLDRFEAVEAMCVFDEYTYQEALAKLEAYEKEPNEIKVGDVVTMFPRSGGEYNAVVVRATNDMHIDVIYSDGITTCNVPPELYKKTGKHIEIQKILEQIGGTE